MRSLLWRLLIYALAALVLAACSPTITPTPARTADGERQDVMPPDFTVAFIADQGLHADSRAVMGLIRDEGADMVLHQGDFDYLDYPDGWDQQINDVLGPAFPYFASIGNHDVAAWGDYQRKLQARLDRVDSAVCTGDLGVKSTCRYRGLFFVISGAGHSGLRPRHVHQGCSGLRRLHLEDLLVAQEPEAHASR